MVRLGIRQAQRSEGREGVLGRRTYRLVPWSFASVHKRTPFVPCPCSWRSLARDGELARPLVSGARPLSRRIYAYAMMRSASHGVCGAKSPAEPDDLAPDAPWRASVAVTTCRDAQGGHGPDQWLRTIYTRTNSHSRGSPSKPGSGGWQPSWRCAGHTRGHVRNVS